MTIEQYGKFLELFTQILSFSSMLGGHQFHHGDCIGADAEAHDGIIEVLKTLPYSVEMVIHPPLDPRRRAFRAGTVLPARNFIPRNHDIVDAAYIVFAAPQTREEQVRSGTWATVRYARKKGTHLHIIYPNGDVDEGLLR